MKLTQILTHCAQSVEFSIEGFPEHKAELFKSTVGKLAFSAFSAKGKMTHALDEIIPGAPLSPEEDLERADERFRDISLSLSVHVWTKSQRS